MTPPYNCTTNILANANVDTWLPTDGRTVPDIPTYFGNNAVFNVLDYGADPTPGNDNATAFLACYNAMVTQPRYDRRVMLIPAGTYEFSVFPAVIDHDVSIIGDGQVLLQHTGTGIAVQVGPLRGSILPNVDLRSIFNITLSNLAVTGNTNTTDSFVFTCVQHSRLQNLRAGKSTSSGFRFQWGVYTHGSELICSANEDNGILPADLPPTGIILEGDAQSNRQVSSCLFENVYVEGNTGIGVHLVRALACTFIGGGPEGVVGLGTAVESGCDGNRFIGWYGEQNLPGGDLEIRGGFGTQIINPYLISATASGILSGAEGTVIDGGVGPVINVASGALGTRLLNMSVGSAIVNNDPSTTTWNCYYYNTHTYAANVIPRATVFGEYISLGSVTSGQGRIQRVFTTPEGSLAADPGSLALGNATNIGPVYAKVDGTGTSGWMPVSYDSTATNGDTDVTLVRSSPRTQLFSTTLTANRSVVLPVSGLYNGLQFTIVRTGLGAFSLAIGSGTLPTGITLPAGVASYATVEYTGAAWAVKAFGYLDPAVANATAITNTATLDFPSIAGGSASGLTITVTGAAVGDSVLLGPPAALEANLVATGYVSAANTVTVRLANPTASAINPASATWRATVVKV